MTYLSPFSFKRPSQSSTPSAPSTLEPNPPSSTTISRSASGSDMDELRVKTTAPNQSKTAHYELNAVQDPALLAREGQLKAAHRIAHELAQTTGSKPDEMKFSVTVPEKRWLNELETGLRKLNNMAQPSGILGHIRQKAFRLRTGVQGPLPPVHFERDAAEPDSKMQVTLNLQQVAADDVVKFASFLRGYSGK